MSYPQFALAIACLCAHMAMAQVPGGAAPKHSPSAVSEDDYLADVPTVISVSRLAQPLADTPGAVTILDRDFIRMTGARDVVDVLRFVPGFQTTSSVETDGPMATYHGRNDDWANRIQVLVDGRSVYSSLQQGSAGLGWQMLAIDDIERIEILRGSNSATYGARAFLGVVNIVSRDMRDTPGTAVSVTRGENGVQDQGMRLGWSNNGASYRVSADSAASEGLENAYGKNHTERLNLSAHFALEQAAELVLRAGGVGMYAGRGEAGNIEGNPARRWFMGTQFLQADWHHPLNEAQDLSISLSHAENTVRDVFPFMTHTPPPTDYFGATVNLGGRESVDTLTATHTVRFNPDLRVAWGAEYRRETVMAPQQFDQTDKMASDFVRVFGSAEWRLSDSLLLNAGALAEHSNNDGDTVSPRLMLNWQLVPGHTLRAGTSSAFRPPSPYEKYAHIQYFDVNGQNPTGYYTFNDGTLKREKLFSRELGYYFAPAGSAFSGDVRLFQEQITDGIAHTEFQIIPGTQAQRYLNVQNYEITGAEWQLNWTPTSRTRVLLSQTWTDIRIDSAAGVESWWRIAHGAPRYAASLALMHRFDAGWNLSVMHQAVDDVALMSTSNHQWLFSMQRTDLRLAKEFRLGGTKAEVAATVQNLGNPYEDGDHKFLFHQRALMTLKFEY